MKPQRIQLSRTKGWRMPPNTIKVDRSTRWGNPFNATQSYTNHRGGVLVPLLAPPSPERCIDLFQAYAMGVSMVDAEWLAPLRGKNLACWCKPGALCHANVLLRLANDGAVAP